MIDNDRIKEIVERNVHKLVEANGGVKTKADEQFVEDMIELGVGLLQAFNDIPYQLSEIVDRMDRMRP
jgi:hypothetical protein